MKAHTHTHKHTDEVQRYGINDQTVETTTQTQTQTPKNVIESTQREKRSDSTNALYAENGY